MNDQLDATIAFGVEQAKRRILAAPNDYAPADLQVVLLARIVDALYERRTWRRRVATAIPWTGYGALVASIATALLKVLG